ncbi:MAG: DUF4292 domain-containing protein [Saprospiraceae bacterium]
MKNILFLIAILSFISSCKPTEGISETKKLTTKFVLKKMADNSIDFNWFSAKIKTNYKSEKESFSATLQVKMEKDKQIWISGQKFGFEGVRMLIDQDSIRIINRLEKTYQVADFSYIQKEFNLPANFEAVQDFLVGNPLKMTDDAMYRLQNDSSKIILDGIEDNIMFSYILDKMSYKLEKFTLEDTEANRKVITQQLDYQATEKHGDFSFLREINLESEETKDISVVMTYSRVDFDEEKTMSFSVPSSYKRL